MLSLCAFMLALCSIVYELLLGQTLSAFLGDTVLRYSVTIGLYMFSMGIGAFAAKQRVLDSPLLALQRVELALALIGAVSLSALFLANSIGVDGILFSLLAHGLIILIGVLTGLELPLLFALGRAHRGADRNIILGIDYLGAFAGTLLFTFVLYPRLGLFASSFLTAGLNALVGAGLLVFRRTAAGEPVPLSRNLAACHLVVLLACSAGYMWAHEINTFWIEIYTGGAGA